MRRRSWSRGEVGVPTAEPFIMVRRWAVMRWGQGFISSWPNKSCVLANYTQQNSPSKVDSHSSGQKLPLGNIFFSHFVQSPCNINLLWSSARHSGMQKTGVKLHSFFKWPVALPHGKNRQCLFNMYSSSLSNHRMGNYVWEQQKVRSACVNTPLENNE